MDLNYTTSQNQAYVARILLILLIAQDDQILITARFPPPDTNVGDVGSQVRSICFVGRRGLLSWREEVPHVDIDATLTVDRFCGCLKMRTAGEIVVELAWGHRLWLLRSRVLVAVLVDEDFLV